MTTIDYTFGDVDLFPGQPKIIVIDARPQDRDWWTCVHAEIAKVPGGTLVFNTPYPGCVEYIAHTKKACALWSTDPLAPEYDSTLTYREWCEIEPDVMSPVSNTEVRGTCIEPAPARIPIITPDYVPEPNLGAARFAAILLLVVLVRRRKRKRGNHTT